jgi:hypothetical protein
MKLTSLIMLIFMGLTGFSCGPAQQEQQDDMTYQEGGAIRPQGRAPQTPPGSQSR